MKYTYYISFNGSDYTQVYPVEGIVITGLWEANSWFDRVKINEIGLLKINNTSIFSTLETWIIDPTKYATDCFFKIKKSGVDWHTFTFGIRWGTIDNDIGMYKFTPQSYDSWYRYYGPYIENNATAGGDAMYYYIYDHDTTNFPYDDFTSFVPYSLFSMYESILITMSSSLSVSSTLLNNDAATVVTVATTRGIIMDYVTGAENFFLSGSYFNTFKNKTVKSFLSVLEIFQIYPFFDDTTTVRLEHIIYLITQLQDNAVSLTLSDDEKTLFYLDISAPYIEKLKLIEGETVDDIDFTTQELKYNLSRIGFTGSIIEKSYDDFTNLDFLLTYPDDYDEKMILSGSQNHIQELVTSATGTFTNDVHYFEITTDDASVYIISNDIKVTNNKKYNIDGFLDVVSGTPDSMSIYIKDRSSGFTISDSSPLSDGVNDHIVLTASASANDGAIVIELSLSESVEITGYFVCVDNITVGALKKYNRVAWDIGVNTLVARLNGPFSQANIVENYWNTYRPTNAGEVNGDAKVFSDSDFIIKRELRSRYYPDDINMKYGINDGTHIAKIDNYVRNLDTDFVTFTLLYQEYE